MDILRILWEYTAQLLKYIGESTFIVAGFHIELFVLLVYWRESMVASDGYML